MSQHRRQIFETSNPWRWRIFHGASLLLLLALLACIPAVLYSYRHNQLPKMPLLNPAVEHAVSLNHPALPKGLNKHDEARYKGFVQFIAHQQKTKTASPTLPTAKEPLRAAFFVDWDPQALSSLKAHAGQLNMVMPEWFFLGQDLQLNRPQPDAEASAVMNQAGLRIMPMLSNYNSLLNGGDGGFDGQRLHRFLHNSKAQDSVVAQLVASLASMHAHGVNLDFEELNEVNNEALTVFATKLSKQLHAHGLTLSIDVIPDNEDYDLGALSKVADWVLLMAYDEHYSTSTAGPVSGQRWVEKMVEQAAVKMPANKLVVCLGGYGYDWPQQQQATTLTYQQALANAKIHGATIRFNNDDYSCNYEFRDADSTAHKVFFNDAATNFNTMRFADDAGTAGVALWRLGSEDERIWRFYRRPLSLSALAAHPFDYRGLQAVAASHERPDYVGEGEVLSVLAAPAPGKLKLEVDSADQLIAEQLYQQLPTRYVVQRYGQVHHQVVLTFDDGPDETYTPQILNILRQEKVPAAFFVVGTEAANQLPLVKRIYQEGHELGNHTFTHPNLAAVSSSRAVAEMEANRLLIEAITGHSTVLFRAPYNADAEPSTLAELKPVALSARRNYYTVGESIDPEDWQPGISADTIVARVVAQYEAHPDKGIVLLHDAGGNRQATVDALPAIIHYFKNKGVQFATVAQLLGKTKNDLMPPVNNPLLAVDSQLAGFQFWAFRVLNGVFWAAIGLGMLRLLVMGGLALRGRRKPTTLQETRLPGVSIVVPAYNEEAGAVQTIASLLAQQYPCFEIVFVNDGSTDDTWAKVAACFAKHPQVKLLTQTNGGKASALNAGIAVARYDYLVCVDGDTRLAPDALLQLMQPFLRHNLVGAVAGNVQVGNLSNLLTHWQNLEYTTAQNFDRLALSSVNAITVIPGAIGAFHKQALLAAGGFTHDTLAEDCDLTIRLLRAGYQVANAPEAIAYTEAPGRLQQFLKQRVRWTFGVMQCFWKHKAALGSFRNKGLGWLAMPNILVFQIVLPLFAPLADLVLLTSLFWNRHDASSMGKIGAFYAAFLLIDLAMAGLALRWNKQPLHRLLWLLPQRFAYRQIMYLVLFKAVRRALRGQQQQWGSLERSGSWTVFNTSTA